MLECSISSLSAEYVSQLVNTTIFSAVLGSTKALRTFHIVENMDGVLHS
jgi:hypothetical protein